MKSCLFGATNIVKNSDKKKDMYSDFEKAFDQAGSWSLSNGSVRNIAIFTVNKSLSSHTDNCKNKDKIRY